MGGMAFLFPDNPTDPSFTGKNTFPDPSSGNHRHYHMPVVSGAIELTEKDILPGGKGKLTLNQRDGLGCTYNAGLQVCIAVIVLGIVLPLSCRNQPVQQGTISCCTDASQFSCIMMAAVAPWAYTQTRPS